MAFDREAARQAGYSDEEIDAYLSQESNKKKTAPAPTVVSEVGEPPAPTTVVPEAGGGVAGAATTAGLAVAPYVATGAAGAAAALGANKLYGAWKQSAQAAQALADAKLASEQGIAQRAAARAMPMPAPSGPVAPQILDAAGRPFAPTAPVAPTAPPAAPMAPAQPAQPSMIDRATQMVRQLALDKVVKGGLGAAAALTPGNIGQNYNFPQSGPLRGSEINPQTGRPWTQQELAAYRAQYGQ
jgi:hypothetical protein